MSHETRPAFWSRQSRLPLQVNHFLQVRLEAALKEPQRRTLLVWPTILGHPCSGRFLLRVSLKHSFWLSLREW